jgi:hypothetical protein
VADVKCCYAGESMSDSNVPQDLRNIKTALRKNRCRAADIQPTAGVGVYALYLSDPHALGGIDVDPSGLLYVGMTEDSLEARNHFGHKDSSFSSPRRSLGAILKQNLGLPAIPRGSGKSAKDMTCYRFADDGEQRLTDWMVKHLEYSFAVLEDGIGAVERALIECLRPPLNLDKWKNPQKKAIMRLRKACADEARRVAGRQQ